MNRFARQPRRPGPAAPALIQALEPRRMFTAATLKHGLLTVYGSELDDIIFVGSPSTDVLAVDVGQSTFGFRSHAVTRLRILGLGGDDRITLSDVYAPNLTDLAINAGDGNNVVTDASLAHKYNRAERVSIVGGAGDDALAGGAHTFFMDGGAGDDTLYGGAAGATLDGGDGNDLVSAYALTLQNVLWQDGTPNDAHGSVVLKGGAGDDVIVGNNLGRTHVSDTLLGGDGNDALYPFSPFYDPSTSDQVLDFGVGADQRAGDDQFVGSDDVSQTATLRLSVDGRDSEAAEGVAYHGPNTRIAVLNGYITYGRITMHGPSGSVFLLGDLLNAAGYPLDKLGVPASVSLKVNGFMSTLTGTQIAGYQINNGDVIELTITSGTRAAPLDYPSTVLADHPVAYWRLGETSGPAVDLGTAGQALNGNYLPAVARGQPGLLPSDNDRAFVATGNGSDTSGVTIPANNLLKVYNGPFSVEAIVQKAGAFGTGDVGFRRIYDYITHGSNDGFLLDMSDNAVRMVGAGSPFPTNTVVVPFASSVGQTYDIVGTYNGSVASIYVNGVLRGSGAFAPGTSYGGDAHIGVSAPGQGFNIDFNGTMDEVSLYNTALTLDQIAAHYAAATAPLPPGAVPAALAIPLGDKGTLIKGKAK